MITFKGYPKDGGLYIGYEVIQDDQVAGLIDVCGIFRKNTDIALTGDEQHIIRDMCKRVYEMPSEYGCLGVGESPTESFEKFLDRTNLRHDLD
jgi:hypothetical protein